MLWFLLACGSERGPRDPGDVVEYDGYLYAGPDASSETLLATGTVRFRLDGGAEVLAEQPFAEDSPGYWRAELPASTPFALRVESEGAYPAVWRGVSPAADGSWYSGALFGGSKAEVDAWFATFGIGVDPVAWGQSVQVWGAPWDAEAWDCAAVRVNGAPVACFAQDAATGTTVPVQSGAFTWFVATGLEPGGTLVESGLGGQELYDAVAGDLVYAFWFLGEGA